MNKEYNVIWIDDEYDKMNAFQDECKIIHHINLVPFRTQKSGMEALDNNLDKFDGVLLDAKMLDKDEDETPRVVGLKNAIAHINQLAIRKSIPYFISTGQPDLMESDIFEDSFGKYYIKERDDERLIADMKEIMGNSPRQQILSMYSDVVQKMDDMDFRGTNIIVRIFEAFHFPDIHTDFDPLLHYTQLRLLLEYIFRACNKYGIVPSECIPNDLVNLNQCYIYLSGKPANIVGVRYGNEGDRVIPSHIERIVSSVLHFGNVNSHTTSLSEEEMDSIKLLLTQTSVSSKYLIFGLTLQVCEVILWFGRYINANQDKDKNRSMCHKFEAKEQSQENPEKAPYTGVLEDAEGYDGTCKIGDDYCINKNVATRIAAIGSKVKIVDYKENTNKVTSAAFKYYVTKLVPVEEG